MRDTINMARKVDPVTALLLDKKLPQGMNHDVFVWFLERFAVLVEAAARADEREACAKLAAATVCDTHIPTGVKIYGTVVAKAIRARGQA